MTDAQQVVSDSSTAQPQGADRYLLLAEVSEFYRLGFGEPFYISAEHGVGEAELRTAILDSAQRTRFGA